MPALESATLCEITADANATEVPNTTLPVQFNPASLNLQLTNSVEGGDTQGRQTRQYLGKTSTTLAFDLHFDSADEGTTDAPLSVRTKTAMVERFVLPKGQGKNKQAPPKARFHWNELLFDGIIDGLTIDFDLFASDGTPLRAKMSVSMREQDAKYDLLAGPGSATGANATPVGASGNGPGTSGGAPPDTTALALGGESAAELAARVGVDPAAWRGLAAGLDSTLSLSAGASIDFNAGLSLNAGIGVSVGVELGASASLEASFGLQASASVSTSAGVSIGGGASAGFALAAAGGVGAAIETVATIKAEAAAADARRAFATAPQAAAPSTPASGGPARGVASLSSGVAAATRTIAGSSAHGQSASAVSGAALPVHSSVNPAPPDQSRTPLAISGMPSTARQAAAPPAPAPPLADSRATTFGFGVPLRPRIGGAAEVRSGAVSGHIPLRPRARVSDVLVAVDPSAPPWTRLPADVVRTKADRAQRSQNPARRCGCTGPCKHGSG